MNTAKLKLEINRIKQHAENDLIEFHSPGNLNYGRARGTVETCQRILCMLEADFGDNDND